MSLCYGLFPYFSLRFYNIKKQTTTNQYDENERVLYEFETLQRFEKYRDTFFKKIKVPQQSMVIVETAQLSLNFYNNLRRQLHSFTRASMLISPFDACLSAAFYHIVKRQIPIENGSRVVVCLGTNDTVIWVLCVIEGSVVRPMKKTKVPTFNCTRANLDELRGSEHVALTFFYAIGHCRHPKQDLASNFYVQKNYFVRDAFMTGAQAKAYVLAKVDLDLYDVIPCLPDFELFVQGKIEREPILLLTCIPYTLDFHKRTKKAMQVFYSEEVLTIGSRRPGRALTDLMVDSFLLKVSKNGMIFYPGDPVDPNEECVPATKLIIRMTGLMALLFTCDPVTGEVTQFHTPESSGFPLLISYASGAPLYDPVKCSEDVNNGRGCVVGGFGGFIGRQKSDATFSPVFKFRPYWHETEEWYVEYLSGRPPNQKKVCRTAKAVFKDLLLGLVNQVDGFDPATDGVALSLSQKDFIPAQLEYIRQIAMDAGLLVTDIALQDFDLTPDMFSIVQ